MSLMNSEERTFARAIASLTYCNPFLPERIEHERRVLGPEFSFPDDVWNVRPDIETERPNVRRLQERSEELLQSIARRARDGHGPTALEQQLHEDLVVYALFYRYHDEFLRLIESGATGPREPAKVVFFRRFRHDFLALRAALRPDQPADEEHIAHLFACSYQVRRAFRYIFGSIVGSSMASARLRAAVWQSIFTHDMRRFRRSLFSRMADMTVLITGATGTGKESVARAIALSRYVAFDPESQTFAAQPERTFHPLNLAALSPTLIESELFGHRRGAFTGALEDHPGWLETCGPFGTVFLDEIGEVSAEIQVKLLRVLESRKFQRLGETTPRSFHGKLIAATNRDLEEAIRAGRFREDLYYRLCSDMITTPSLQEQVQGRPEHLRNLISFLARRLVTDAEADVLTTEVMSWIGDSLGWHYAWPGNVRELDQCLRNILIRREYRPPSTKAPDTKRQLADEVMAGTLTAEELMRRYCSLVYAQTANYQEAARRLELDPRTLKSKLDAALVKELRAVE